MRIFDYILDIDVFFDESFDDLDSEHIYSHSSDQGDVSSRACGAHSLVGSFTPGRGGEIAANEGFARAD